MSTVPTNPADCDRTTVYTGECRNFADTEWIQFDSGRRRSPDARDGNTWLIDVAHGSFWMSDDKVRNLVRLVPARPIARAEATEARTTPAVPLHQPDGTHMDASHLPIAPDDDPAVYVVRESDIAAVQVKRNAEGDWWTKNRGCGEGATADGMRQMVGICIRDAIEYEAIARAIEAEQSVDPVEKKAIEYLTVMFDYEDIDSASPADWEAATRMARHVLGQEDRHVDQ